ncbi:glutathione S-transferase family protein [Marinomonas pollencensis]|uniref:Putative glutathione S-transferase n=1 Tax=Marinomonas pollencensis TaxID=491954 RepID=A0A3E0DTX3_9GAMM|nr:glutathione S-transferase family protein [Marinomonas pollencensis]REG87019.1 putative glutathione S-transferase [Marinomonas pollencensis]
MGLLIEGKWVDQWYDTKATKGKFVRSESEFRRQIVPCTDEHADQALFPAQDNRYHLYVSLACPWAHRTLIFRKLKQLDNIISVSCVHPTMAENGWEFNNDQAFFDDHIPMGDPLYQSHFAHQLYTRAKPTYTGRVTVPILWDKKTHTIVSNESADIIRIFNSAFNDITHNKLDFYPAALRSEIDSLNERIYNTINNGVYKCGFATTQAAYEEALIPLFSTLDFLEEKLSEQDYLLGAQPTEADWRLFTTLIRFDSVYFSHFKCNLKRLLDYPILNAYLKRLYETEGVAETVNFRHIKHHYYYSHQTINPTRIIPVGPTVLFNE